MRFHQVSHLRRTGELDKVPDDADRFRPCYQIQRPGERETAVADIVHRCLHAIQWQQLDRRTMIGFVLGGTDLDIANRSRIAGHRLDALLVIANDHMRLHRAGLQVEMVQKQFQR